MSATSNPSPIRRASRIAPFALMMISAKGGVGKSTLTVNLAAALTARGKKVGIFDADIHGPNIPALLGVRQKRGVSEPASGGRPHPETMMPIEARLDGLDMRPIQPFERYGMNIMSLALLMGDTQAITPPPDAAGQMIRLLLNRVAWDDTDVVLIDMPPGTGEPLHTLLNHDMIDAAVIVTTREKLAHLDNGRLIRVLEGRVPIFGVVENMTHIICPNCGERIDLYPSPAEGEAIYHDLPILGAIPFHPHVLRETRAAAPIALNADPEVIDSPVRAPLLQLADAVIEKMSSVDRSIPSTTKDDDCIDCP